MRLRFTFSVIGVAVLTSSQLTGCTTSAASDNPGSGGSNAAGNAGTNSTAGSSGTVGLGGAGSSGSSAGSAGSTGSGGSAGGTMGGGTCATEARPVAPLIANFDNCAVGSVATMCSVPAIAGTTLFGGVFSYDDGTGNPMFSVTAGHAGSALALASTDNATQYGGGFGVWTSGCFDASSYSGVTFWVRGSAPDSGKGKMTLQVSDTTPITPPAGMTNTGTCPGTTDTCKQPKAPFPVTDTWSQVHLTWADFQGGDAAGTPVTVTGANIIQVQWEVGLAFTLDAATNMYVPVPAPYELQIDDVAFE